MAKESLILICACLVFTQFVVANAANDEDIDWTTLHAELRKLAGNIRKKCIGETGATNAELEAADVGDFSGEKLACYFKCVMEKGGVMKKDGKLNLKLMAKMLPQAYRHIGVEMLDQCRNTGGSDKCEIAMIFNQCMYKANPVAYFVI
ncbi:hypothetical protein PUN28_000220 [Cardiocondyla obscurior]